jgi:predicted metal-dependent peptidase
VQLAVQQARGHVRALGKHLPGDVERQIRWTYEDGRIDWTETLWRFVDSAACCAGGDWSWTRPSAWYLQQNIVLPTLVHEGLGVLPIAIDTSGSMTDEQIQAVQVELQTLLREGRVEEVRVLYVDTRVRAEESFFEGQQVQLQPRGGGGTDFRAAFRQLDGESAEVPALVFFTDLIGVFPEEPPSYPTLWVHTWPGPPQNPVPFGEVIHMPR